MTPWLANLEGNSWMDRLRPEGAVFLRIHYRVPRHSAKRQSQGELLDVVRSSAQKAFLFKASVAMTKDRHTQQRKAATREEVSKAKTLW